MSIAAKPQFRYDINTLRALAILGVLLFHYKVKSISGGFSGVDVFFVISGFLMTKIIISSIDRGEFNFWKYLQKRFFRIVPALLLLLLSILVLSFFLYFPEDYKVVAKNAASSVLFLSNILYWRGANYFAQASDTNVLLHTWSLSVEWQFYLLYPFALQWLKYLVKRQNVLITIFIIITSLLFFFSVLSAKINPTAAFYLLPTRAWEMMVGGIAFLFEGKVKHVKIRKGLAWLGYAMIFFSFFALEASKTWPSLFTALPVLGTFAVIMADENTIFIVRNDFIQYIGKISYSLYLWHWPLYVIAQYQGVENSIFFLSALILLVVVVSILSYKYVENMQYRYSIKAILSFSVLGLLCAILLSQFNTNNFLYKEGTLKIASYQAKHTAERNKQYRNDTCHIDNVFKNFRKDICLCRLDTKKNILLLGDSHMGMLVQSFIEKGRTKNIHFLQATASATLPFIKDYQHRDKEKRKLMDYIFKEFLPKNAASLDGVIIGGSWSGQKDVIHEDSILIKGLKETLFYLKKYKLKTVILGQNERYTLSYPIIAARDFQNGTNESFQYLESSPYKLDKYLAEHLSDSYYPIINNKNLPTISSKYVPYMVDNHHVSKFGADLIVEKIFSDPKFLTLLALN